jgi:hypothetical protein
MKKFIYTSIILLAFLVTAKAQLKDTDMKRKNDFFRHIYQNQDFKNQTQYFLFKKIKPYPGRRKCVTYINASI